MVKVIIKNQDKEYLFKNDVPVFPYISYQGNVIDLLIFPNQTNIINYSFRKDICQEHSLQVLNNEQITGILNRFNAVVSEDYKENLLSFRSLVMQKPPIFNLDPYNDIKSASSYIKSITTTFLKEIECFIDVKFSKISSLELLSSEKYSISLCVALGDSLSNQNRQASASFAYDDKLNSHYVGAILFDKEVKHNPSSLLYRHSENTIKHEILHTLKLGHAYHSSLRNNLKYRSIVEDSDDMEKLPLSKECLKKSNDEDMFKCIEPPKTLTPVDVKGLISIWGMSKDDSAFCQDTRQEFVEKYSHYLDLVGRSVIDGDL